MSQATTGVFCVLLTSALVTQSCASSDDDEEGNGGAAGHAGTKSSGAAGTRPGVAGAHAQSGTGGRAGSENNGGVNSAGEGEVAGREGIAGENAGGQAGASGPLCDGEVATPLPAGPAAPGPQTASCDALFGSDADIEGNASIEAVRKDSHGDTVIAGYFKGTLRLDDVELESAGDMDVFVAKFDAECKRVWSHSYGDAAQQYFSRGLLAIDPSDDILLSFYNDGSIDLGDGPKTGNFVVAKLASSGATLWSRDYDPMYGGAMGIASDADGNVVLAGRFKGSLAFGPTPLEATDFSGFAAKLDGSGHHLWSASFNGNTGANNGVSGIAVDPASGDVYLTGGFYNEIIFGEKTLTNDTTDVSSFAAKLRGCDGGVLWANDFPKTSLYCVATNGTGAVMVSGLTYPEQAGYVASLGSTGVAEAVRTFADVSWTTCSLDRAGNWLVAGGAGATVNLGGDDLWLPIEATLMGVAASFSPAGAHEWSTTYGTSGKTWFTDMNLTVDGALSFGVATDGTVDFGKGLLTSQYSESPDPHNGYYDAGFVRFPGGELPSGGSGGSGGSTGSAGAGSCPGASTAEGGAGDVDNGGSIDECAPYDAETGDFECMQCDPSDDQYGPAVEAITVDEPSMLTIWIAHTLNDGEMWYSASTCTAAPSCVLPATWYGGLSVIQVPRGVYQLASCPTTSYGPGGFSYALDPVPKCPVVHAVCEHAHVLPSGSGIYKEPRVFEGSRFYKFTVDVKSHLSVSLGGDMRMGQLTLHLRASCGAEPLVTKDVHVGVPFAESEYITDKVLAPGNYILETVPDPGLTYSLSYQIEPCESCSL